MVSGLKVVAAVKIVGEEAMAMTAGGVVIVPRRYAMRLVLPQQWSSSPRGQKARQKTATQESPEADLENAPQMQPLSISSLLK